jgi:hypothetical protein
MKHTSARLTGVAVNLASQSVSCNSCFDLMPLKRAGISLPQPFAVGRGYRPGGIAIVGINPGASMGGGYKERRKHALDKFAAGDEGALEEYWDALAEDAANYWNPRYLARLRALRVDLNALLVGNVALCATAENKYPKRMLRNCWGLHTASVLKTYAPGTLIFMGSSSVMDEFVLAAETALPTARVLRIAHYAHREGHVHEVEECERILKVLSRA